MSDIQIKFSDGTAYEDYMGRWSQMAGDVFLDWLSPKPGLRWLDVGCGNGAFTDLIVRRCAPAAVDGIDPSKEQLAFARKRESTRAARFQEGSAMALPFADHSFDVAVMPLVIFFVPDPYKGVAELARVVAPGGLVTAYGWHMEGGGFPYGIVQEAMQALEIPYGKTPFPDAANEDRLRAFWSAAGLTDIATREIRVTRTFAGPDELWATVRKSPALGSSIPDASSPQWTALRNRVAARLRPDASGRITLQGRANAIRGRVPA